MKIFVVLIFCFSAVFADEVWNLTSLNYPPYSDETIEGNGILVQKLKKKLVKHSIYINIQYLPWKRAIKQANLPDYDGYFPAWKEEVTEGFFVSEPIGKSIIAIISRKDSKFKYKFSYASLIKVFKNNKIGLVKTYTYSDSISTYAKQFTKNIVYAPNSKALYEMLLRKRSDLIIADVNVIKHYYKNDFEEKFFVHKIIEEKDLVIALKKTAKNYLKNNLLKKLLK